MIRIPLSALLIFICSICFSQQGEYFVDKDPGFNEGSSFSGNSQNDFDFEFEIDVQNLSMGYHRLFVRYMIDGIWSHTKKTGFYVFNSKSLAAQIVTVEYFFDDDPGIGQGIKIPIEDFNDYYFFDRTLNTENLSPGPHTLYLRAKNSLDHWSPTKSFEFLVCEINPPEANFDYIVNGHRVTIIDSAKYADDYNYSFGKEFDTKISRPTYEFNSPGVYEICQTVNNGCSSNTICKEVGIVGINGVSPLSAGNEGNVSLYINGAGLLPGSKVFLENDGQKIFADTTISYNNGEDIVALFTFEGNPIGSYKVGIQKLDNEITFYDAPFILETVIEANPYVRIHGRSELGRGRLGKYTIEYGNKGNVDAFNVPVWIMILGDTNDLEVNMGLDYFIPENLSEDIKEIGENLPPYFNVDSIAFKRSQNVTLNLLAPARLKRDNDSLIIYRPGRVYPIVIPFVAANSSNRINFHLQTFSSTSTSIQILALRFPSLGNQNVNYSSFARVQESEIQCLASILLNEINEYELSQEFDSDCAISFWNTVYATYLDAIVRVKRGGSPFSKTSVINMGIGIAGTVNECLPRIIPNPISRLIEAFTFGYKIGEILNCFLPDFSDHLLNIDIVRPFDPNEKIGFRNPLGSNFFSYDKDFYYTIFFENVDSATAPAQEVFISDLLDTEKFSIESFELQSFGFGDFVYDIPHGMQNYTTDIDLRSDKNLIVRFNAKMDSETGQINWYFGSLDPQTMEIPEDPFKGFLPPNQDDGRGEGFVSFKIDVNPSLQHGSEISNFAEIVFDFEDPIITPIWTNVKDIIKPESSFNSELIESTSDIVEISWNGKDESSGIAFYDLYVTNSEGTFEPVLSKTTTSTVLLQLRERNEYEAYIIAYDSAGNREEKSSSEITIRRSSVTSSELEISESMQLFPNPSNDYVAVSFPYSMVNNIFVIDSNGRRRKVKYKYLKSNSVIIELKDIKPGVYVVLVESDFGVVSYKLVKQ